MLIIEKVEELKAVLHKTHAIHNDRNIKCNVSNSNPKKLQWPKFQVFIILNYITLYYILSFLNCSPLVFRYGTVQLTLSVSTAEAPDFAARIRSLSVFTPRNLKNPKIVLIWDWIWDWKWDWKWDWRFEGKQIDKRAIKCSCQGQ